MKYELKLLVKNTFSSPYELKYRCVVPENRYEATLVDYHGQARNLREKSMCVDCVILCNKLDDEGNFLEVVF